MRTNKRMAVLVVGTISICLSGLSAASAQDSRSDAELAKKLANPIASLISIPIKIDYNSGYGPQNGENVTTTIQPVIPFQLSEDLSLVTRTLLPIAWQDNIAGNSGEQFGLNDTLQSFFFVPNPVATPLGTLTYGAGPAVTWPTSTARLLGAGTMGLGPTGVFLFQKSGWTYGALVTQQWGVAKTRNNVPDLNLTALQPFLTYTTPDAWTFGVNTESSYNWTSEQWSVPINFTISKLTAIGNQRVQLQAGARYWAESPTGGPDDFGVRAQITFLFPN